MTLVLVAAAATRRRGGGGVGVAAREGKGGASKGASGLRRRMEARAVGENQILGWKAKAARGWRCLMVPACYCARAVGVRGWVVGG